MALYSSILSLYSKSVLRFSPSEITAEEILIHPGLQVGCSLTVAVLACEGSQRFPSFHLPFLPPFLSSLAVSPSPPPPLIRLPSLCPPPPFALT